MHILGLDVGTSSVKAAVLDIENNKMLASEPARVEYELDAPTPDAAEMSTENVWQAVADAARQAVQKAGLSGAPTEIAGVGLSCLMPALVLLDDADQPLRPVWTHLDRRARPVARDVWAEVGDEFLATVGNRPLPGGISALCFRQMVKDDPYLVNVVRSYLHLNGWLALKMTGERFFDPANASFTGLFNTVTNQQWSPRWCDYFQIERRWLPDIVCGSSEVGLLRSRIATQLGVPAGIPVKMGTADTSSAMLAAKLKPGELMHTVGTTQVLAGIVDKPHPAPCRLIRMLGVGKEILHVTHNPVGGEALDWLYKLCFRDQSKETFYGQTVLAAMDKSTRVRLDPPFLGGDRLEIEPAFAAFKNLDVVNTGRDDLLAALLQAMLEQHRKAVDALGLGDHFERIVLTGGAGKLVRQLIPEYQSAHVEMLEEGSLMGIAKLW